MTVTTDTAFDVAVIGTGYVGLTTGACLAHLGSRVVCADIDEHKVRGLRGGHIPIVEDGLDEIVRDTVTAGRLEFVVGAVEAARQAPIVFLCLPTPQSDDGSADLSYIESAAAEIGPILPLGAVVVNKSTVPVGSTVVVDQMLQRPDVSVVSNPEFLREGSAVSDFLNPDRVVIGGDDEVANQAVAALYKSLESKMIITDAASAETIKYAANGFLAMKISFANEVAALCEAVGADVKAVVAGIGADERIGNRFLDPGPGWGGSCFPKDSRALVSIAAQYGYEFALMRSAVTVNIEQRERMLHKIAAAVDREVKGIHPLEGVVVAALGLTFKAGTDDMRESPALSIIERLAVLGAQVQAFDPTTVGELDAVQQMRLDGLVPKADVLAAIDGADVAVILTEWIEFARIDFNTVASRMRGKAVVDTRNLLDSAVVTAAGLTYEGVGRRS